MRAPESQVEITLGIREPETFRAAAYVTARYESERCDMDPRATNDAGSGELRRARAQASEPDRARAVLRGSVYRVREGWALVAGWLGTYGRRSPACAWSHGGAQLCALRCGAPTETAARDGGEAAVPLIAVGRACVPGAVWLLERR